MDNNKFSVVDFAKNKQYRAIIILIFYFFLFFFLIVAVRNVSDKDDDSNNVNNTNKIKDVSTINSFSKIKSKNFTYKYTLTIDDKVYLYTGEKYENKDRFNVEVDKEIKKYVQIENFSFEIKNDEQVLTDRPIYFLDFFDVDIIEDIIINAKSRGNNVYFINNKDLDNILDSQFGVNNKLDNDIFLGYQDDIITRIDIDYTNYVKFNNKKVNKVLLTLEYSNFGSVEDFDIKN